MANTIVNLPNSFIRFGENQGATCLIGPEYIYPYYRPMDFIFMFLVTGTTEAFVSNIGCKASSMSGGLLDTLFTIPLHYLDLGSGNFLVYNSYADLSTIEHGDIDLSEGYCFAYVLYSISLPTTYYGTGPRFYYTYNLCFTNKIDFRCSENSFGYYYEEILAEDANWFQSVRIRATLHSPQYPVNKNVFRLSNGTYKKLSAMVQEEYDCLVDYANKNFHRQLSVTLEHDTVIISEASALNTANVISEADDYKIDWDDKPGNYTGVAQAKFKVKTQPFFNVNSNI